MGLGCDPVLAGELAAERVGIAGGLPLHVEDGLRRAQVRLGIAVAVEAPLHVQRLVAPGERHLVDRPVA